MLFCIVPQVAALAKSGQVAESVVVAVVIEVRYSKDHFAAGDGVRLVVFGAAPLAAISRPPESDQAGNQRPFWMVVSVINRHRLRGVW
jgi:hypothetical protein